MPQIARRHVRRFAETDISVGEDPGLLELLRRSGCAEVLIGLESPLADGLDGLETRAIWKLSRFTGYREALCAIQEHGIRVNGCFVLGLDGQGDAALGLLFLLAPEGVFAWFRVEPPNHYGYVRFPAALLVIFGVMFFAVALDPRRNRNLIPFGIMLKLAYCGVVFGYWAVSGLPTLWKPFAVFDAAFALLFLQAWRTLGEGASLR